MNTDSTEHQNTLPSADSNSQTVNAVSTLLSLPSTSTTGSAQPTSTRYTSTEEGTTFKKTKTRNPSHYKKSKTQTASILLHPAGIPTIQECLASNQYLVENIQTCLRVLTSPFKIASIDVANQLSLTTVSCLCSSEWKKDSINATVSLSRVCPPLAGTSKENALKIFNGCASEPWKSQEIIEALGVKVQLMDGSWYAPFSHSSNTYKNHMNVHFLIFAIFTILYFYL